MPPCPVFYVESQQHQHIVEHTVIVRILLERDLAAERLCVLRLIFYHFAVINTERELSYELTVLAEAFQYLVLTITDVTHRVVAYPVQLFRRLRSHGVKRLHIAVDHEINEFLRSPDLKIAVGLLLFARSLGGRL